MTTTLSLDSFTTFGALLKYLRQRQRLTQRELGLAVGYGDAQINRLERNLRLPDVGVVVAQFIAALHLEDEPLVAARLVELAAQARGEPVPQSISFTSTSSTKQQHQRVEEIYIGVPSKRRSNLPAPLTNLIGRKREVEEVQQLLRENRMVTLIGAGGVGKTRLSQAAAAELLDTYADGVWWVELAALTDPAFVPDIIASALRLKDQPGHAPMESITDYFEAKHALLILDNCEHLIAACADVAEHLLRQCPGLHILATSRETLRVPGEVVYRVPSLTTPQTLNDASNLSDYESVRLFVERAHVAQPKFGLTASNAAAVVQVCQRLDGIPLALELAAARLKMLSIEQIAARLDDRFNLLTSGVRTALPRQQTLRATVAWSVDLLTQPERELLAHLSVFAGGFTAEAAGAICEQSNILDLLLNLVDKSLVIADVRGEQAHYRMLETIREFALQQTSALGELSQLQRKHADFFLAFAEAAQPNFYGTQTMAWLNHLECEHNNLRAALEWLIRHDEQAALQLSTALGAFWHQRGYWHEGRRWLETVLSRNLRVSLARAQALFWLGRIARRQMDHVYAPQYCEESIALFRELGDMLGLAHALSACGWALYSKLGYEPAVPLFHESLALFRQLNDRRGIAVSLLNLCHVAFSYEGDYELAVSYLKESRALYQEMNDEYGIAVTSFSWGNLESFHGNYKLQRDLLLDSLERFRSLGATFDVATNYQDLGEAYYFLGDLKTAQQHWQSSLALHQELGAEYSVAVTFYHLARLERNGGELSAAMDHLIHSLNTCRDLEKDNMAARGIAAIGGIALVLGQFIRATILLSAAQKHFDSVPQFLAPTDHAEYERDVAACRTGLSRQAFDEAWAEGQAMSLEQAVAYALEYSAA